MLIRLLLVDCRDNGWDGEILVIRFRGNAGEWRVGLCARWGHSAVCDRGWCFFARCWCRCRGVWVAVDVGLELLVILVHNACEFALCCEDVSNR
jgi:hypothetical protein